MQNDRPPVTAQKAPPPSLRKSLIPIARAVLAITIAAFLWATLQLADSYRTSIELPIRYERLPEQLKLVRPLPERLQLTAYGRGGDLIRPSINLFFSDTAVVDLNAYIERGFVLTNQLRPNLARALPSGIEILDVQPDTLQLNIEEKVIKRVPLVSRIEVDPEAGWFFNAPVRLEPDSVTLTGASSELDTIDQWQTEPMVLSGMGDLSEVYVNVASSDQLVAQPPVAHATLNIERYTEFTVTKKVFARNVPVNKHLRFLPAEVEVTYLAPMHMARTIKEQDFSVSVDYNQLQTDVPTVIPTIERQPNYVIRLRSSPPYVRYVITDRAAP